MSDSSEHDTEAKRDPERYENVENAKRFELKDAKTSSAATFFAKRITDIDDVTGDGSDFAATKSTSLGYPSAEENTVDKTHDVVPSTSMDNLSGKSFDNGVSVMDVEPDDFKNRRLHNDGVESGEQEPSSHTKKDNGQLRQHQPHKIYHSNENDCRKFETDESMRSASYAGFVNRKGGGDRDYITSVRSEYKGEEQVEDDNGGGTSRKSVSKSEIVHSMMTSGRKNVDGVTPTESDDRQIVDAREGADNIPGVDDLPIFANEQSKALNDEIKRRDQLVSRAENAVADNRERVRVMEEHLKNVRQEVGHTNALMAAKKKEITTEEHLCALVARETARHAHEARRFVVEAEEAQDKLNVIQNAIFSANESMDRFKLQMNWNQEELEQWALAAKQKEEDNLALQKYTRADEVKIKELSLQVERISKSVVAKRAELQNLEAESSSKQVELDNTADDFRRLHTERQDLVRQWQDAVNGMRQRDDEMNAVGEKYAKARRLRAEKIDNMSQNAARLKMQQDHNEEVNGSIESLKRAGQRRREESQAAQKRLEEFRDVLDVVKNTLGNGAGELARKRTESANLASQIEEKRLNLEAARRRYQASKQRVKAETNNSNKAEATAKSAEEGLQQREGDLRVAKKILDAAKEEMFRNSQKLYALRQEEASLITDICASQSTMKNLQKKLHGLDQEQTRQQELVYTAEFQIQQMERKVARGMGERTDEEKSTLNTKIRELEGEVEILREGKKMLTAQARKLNNELRICLRRKEAAEAQQSRLDESINELELECRAAEADVRREAQTKEELMVSNDVMRLEMKRLRDTLNGAADEVFSLENRRQQLGLSMKERKAEIQVHWDLQRATLRAAEQERHRVQVELGDRLQAIENLRARYETLVKGFAGVGDLGGSDMGGVGCEGCSSQTYFVIAAAQKREELQRQGDELDQEIRQRERELRVLESTLRHLHARNVDFRVSFQRADPRSRDADSLRKLETRVKAAQDGLFRRKKEFQREQTDHDEDLARLEGARSRTARLDEKNAQFEVAKAQAEAQLQTQREALAKEQARLGRHRASHRMRNNSGGGGAAKRADPSVSATGEATAESASDDIIAGSDHVDCAEETLTEKTLRARTIHDTASGVLYTLSQVAREFPEMRDVLNSSLKPRRLRIPPAPPTRCPGRVMGGSAGVCAPGRNRSSSSSSSAGSGSRTGSRQSSSGDGCTRSFERGGGGSVWGGGLGNSLSSRSGVGVTGNGVSPMRVFEAPL